jgi:hypothetical protein
LQEQFIALSKVQHQQVINIAVVVEVTGNYAVRCVKAFGKWATRGNLVAAICVLQEKLILPAVCHENVVDIAVPIKIACDRIIRRV